MRIRAFGVQSPPVSDIRHQTSPLLPRTFAGCAVRRATRYVDRRNIAFQTGTDIFRVYTGDRMARRKEIPFFQTLIGERTRQNASGAWECRENGQKQKSRSMQRSPALRAVRAGRARNSRRSNRVSAEIGETRAQARRGRGCDRGRAEIARALARGDRHPAAGHRVSRCRRPLHSLEQEVFRDLQPQLRPVRAGRAAAGYDPHRRRARRLSGSDRPRRGMDRRAARQALSGPASATSRSSPTAASS